MGFSLQLSLQRGHRGRKSRNRAHPLLPAALLFIKDGILPAPPLPVPLPHWIISSLPPHRQFASHHLLVIIILDDKTPAAPAPSTENPCLLYPAPPRGRIFYPKEEKKKTERPFQVQLFCVVVFGFFLTLLIYFLGFCLLFRRRWARFRNKQDLLRRQ